MAPLSNKQKREDLKFLTKELRDNISFAKDQKRKDEAHQAKLAKMQVPPMMSMPKPTNPEAGPKDKIPALLAPGEAVIPAKAAQKPENKPLIKALVREGRSDRNMSVPMPKGFMCGTDKVKGYELGTINAYGPTQEEIDAINAQSKGSSLVENIKNLFTPSTYADVNKPVEVEVPKLSTNLTEEVPVNATGLNTLEPPVVSSPDTIAMRNNNPGNLRFGGVYNKEKGIYEDTGKRLEGQTGFDPKTGFAIFPDHESGRGALEKQIVLDTQTRGMTLDKFITKYAPASDNNDPKGYAQTIAKELGIKPTDKIPADKIPLVADVITRVESGGKYVVNAKQKAEEVKAKEEEDKGPELLNDLSLVPEITINGVPQATAVQTEDYLKNIPQAGGTQQQEMLRDQETKIAEVPKTDKTILGNYYDFGKETIVDGLTAIGNNIKDPKVLTNNLKSFVTDTLGFNGQDAAKFVSLYLAQRAMGVSERGASLFAGKYTLQNSDARAAREQQHISSMEQKGYIYDPKTKKFSPGDYKPTGELKNITFDQGGLSGQTFSYRTNKRGGDGAEEMFIEGTNIPISTLVELNKRDPKELIDAKDPSRGTVGEALNKIKARYTSGSMRAAGAGDTPDAVAKRVTDVAKSIDFEKKLNQQLPITKEASNRSTNAEIRSRLPDTETMRSNVIVAANKHGVKLSNEREVAEFNQVANNAIDDAIRHAASSKDKTLNVEAFIDNAIMLHSEGISNEMYKDPSGKKMNPSEIKTQMASLFKAYEGDRAAAIKDMVKWQQEYNTNESLRDKYQGFTHSTGKTGQSGFYMYVQSEILKKQKKN